MTNKPDSPLPWKERLEGEIYALLDAKGRLVYLSDHHPTIIHAVKNYPKLVEALKKISEGYVWEDRILDIVEEALKEAREIPIDG